MNEKKIAKVIYIVVAIFCVAVLLFSCSPYKRLQDRRPKNDKEKSQLAAACLQQFPVVEKKDSSETVDSTIDNNDAEIIELNKIIDSLLIEPSKKSKDTSYIEDTAEINALRQRLNEVLNESCPPKKTITITKTVTVIKPDAAKEYLLQQHINQLQSDSTRLTSERDAAIKERNDIQEKQESSITYNLKMAVVALFHKWWWYVILAIAGAMLYFKINPFPLFKNIISKFKK